MPSRSLITPTELPAMLGFVAAGVLMMLAGPLNLSGTAGALAICGALVTGIVVTFILGRDPIEIAKGIESTATISQDFYAREIARLVETLRQREEAADNLQRQLLQSVESIEQTAARLINASNAMHLSSEIQDQQPSYHPTVIESVASQLLINARDLHVPFAFNVEAIERINSMLHRSVHGRHNPTYCFADEDGSIHVFMTSDTISSSKPIIRTYFVEANSDMPSMKRGE